MAWSAAGASEVAWRRHDAVGEMVLPKTIDPNARRQRIVRTNQPARKCQPSPCLVGARPRGCDEKRRLVVGQHGGNSRTDQAAGVLIVATLVDVSGRRVASIPERANVRLRNLAGLECQYLLFSFLCGL